MDGASLRDQATVGDLQVGVAWTTGEGAQLSLGLVEREETRAWDALEEARTRAERGAISVSLQQAGRNVTEAARQLGVSRMTLYRLMAKHGIGHDLRN